MADDAAWCWFNEPRLLADADHSLLYASFISHGGDVGVVALNTATDRFQRFILDTGFQVDDHNVPGLVILSDGRLMAFWSEHGSEDVIYHRTATEAGSINEWGPTATITTNIGTGITYPKPVLLGSRLWLFYRLGVGTQGYIYSDDEGATWTTAKRLFSAHPDDSTTPYVNLHGSDTRIDFLISNGHPSDAFTGVSMFHFWMDADGDLYETDGTLISAIADVSTTTGLRATDITQVFDGTGGVESWGWDLALDASGNPVAVFASFEDIDNHTYRYARWNGTAWVVSIITSDGGGEIDHTGIQPNYSGGIAVLPSDATVVFTSRPVDGQWEIERWTTDDDGATWTATTSITSASYSKQVRPTTPTGHYDGCPEVAWMSGRYASYLDYRTKLLRWPT